MLCFRWWWAVGGPCGRSGTQALSKLSRSVPVITLLPHSHYVNTCSVMVNRIPLASFLYSMQNIKLSQQGVLGEGHLWFLVVAWWIISVDMRTSSRVPPQMCTQNERSLATLQPQLGLAITFLGPTYFTQKPALEGLPPVKVPQFPLQTCAPGPTPSACLCHQATSCQSPVPACTLEDCFLLFQWHRPALAWANK